MTPFNPSRICVAIVLKSSNISQKSKTFIGSFDDWPVLPKFGEVWLAGWAASSGSALLIIVTFVIIIIIIVIIICSETVSWAIFEVFPSTITKASYGSIMGELLLLNQN